MHQYQSRDVRPLCRLGWLALGGIACFGLIGCEPSEIKKYSAGRDKTAPDYTRLGSYQVPDGWTRQPASKDPNNPALATFQAGEGDKPAVITISRMRGDLEGNIVRWRKRLELPPAEGEELLKGVTYLTVDGIKTGYVDLTNPAKKGGGDRILGAVTECGPSTWVFFMRGTPEQVASWKAKFEAFVQSVKFGGTGASDG